MLELCTKCIKRMKKENHLSRLNFFIHRERYALYGICELLCIRCKVIWVEYRTAMDVMQALTQ